MKFGIGPAIAGKLTSQVAMVAILATATVGGVSIISSSVFASLDATGTYSPQTIDNGTLLLTATDATSPLSGGFTAAIDLLAPADIVHRYVTVVNTGTIAGLGLTLSGTPTSPTTLDVRLRGPFLEIHLLVVASERLLHQPQRVCFLLSRPLNH